MLVTGASGFIGQRVVRSLTSDGFQVRALIRRESDVRRLERAGATPVMGDVRDLASVVAAMSGVGAVVHAAADTTGTMEGGRETTIGGTRNVLEAMQSGGVSKLVYISSCSVYGYAGQPPGAVIDETAPLEPRPELRGPYSWAKTVADEEVGRIADDRALTVFRLRPGLVYGPGGDPANPMVGLTLGGRWFLIIDQPGHVLPLVHVDDLAAAIVLAVGHTSLPGGTFNVVGPERVEKRVFVEQVVRPAHPDRHFIRVPYALFYSVVAVVELVCRVLRVHPPLTRYRLASSQRRVVISADLIMDRLGWRPVHRFSELSNQLRESESTADADAGDRRSDTLSG